MNAPSSDVQRLEVENKRLYAELQKTKRMRFSNAQVARLKSEASQQQIAISRLEAQLQDRDRKIQLLTSKTSDDELELQNKHLEESIEKLQQENERLKRAETSLQEELAQKKESGESSSRILEKKLKNEQACSAGLKEVNDSLSRQLEEQKAANVLRRDSDQEAAHIEELKASLEGKEEEQKELQSQLLILTTQLKACQSELEAAHSQYQKDVSRLTQEHDEKLEQMRSVEEEKDAAIDSLQTRLKVRETEMKTTDESYLSNTEPEQIGEHQDNETVATLTEELRIAQRETEETRAKIHKLEELTVDQSRRIEELERERDEAVEQETYTLKSVAEKIAYFEQRNRELEASLARTIINQQPVSESKSKEDPFSDGRAEELTSTETTIATDVDPVGIQKLEADLAASEQKNADLERRIAFSENVIMTLSNQLREQRELVRENSETETLLQEKDFDLKTIRERLMSSQMQLEKAESVISELQLQLEREKETKAQQEAANENLKLKTRVEDLEQNISNLQELNKRSAEDNERIIELQDTISDMTSQIFELEKALAVKEERCKHLEASVEDYKRESFILSQLEENKEALLDADSKSLEQDRLHQLEEELLNVRDERDRFLTDLEAKNLEVQSAQESVRRTKEENKTIQNDLEKCVKELSFANAEVDSMSSSLTDARVQLAEAQAKVNTQGSRSTSGKGSASEHELQRRLEEQMRAHTEKARNLNDNLDDLEDQLNFTDEKNGELRRELNEVNKKLWNAEAKLSNFDHKGGGRNGTDSLSRELSNAKLVARRNADEVKQLRNLVQSKNKKISILVTRNQDEKKATQKLRKEFDNMKAKLYETERDASELKSTLSSFQKSLEVAEAKKLAIEKQNARLKECEQQLSESESTIREIQDKLQEAEDQIFEKEATISMLQEYQERYESTRRENNSLSINIDRLKHDEAAAERNQKLIESLRCEVQRQKRQIAEQQYSAQHVTISDDEWKNLERENERLRADVLRFEENEKRFSQYNETIDALRQDLAETTSLRIQELQSQIEKLEQQNKVLLPSIESTADEDTHDSNKVGPTDDKYQTLRGQYEDLQKQLSSELLENSKQAETILCLEKELKVTQEEQQNLLNQVQLLKEAEQLAAQEHDKIATLEKELAIASARVEEAEHIIDEFEELEDQLQQSKLDNDHMHEVLRQFRNKSSSDDASLQDQLKAATEQVDQLKRDLKIVTKELEQAQFENSELVAELQMDLEVAERANKELQTDDVAALRRDLDSANSQIAEQDQVITSLRVAIDEVTTAQTYREELVKNLEQELQQTTDKLKGQAQELKVKEETYASERSTLERLLKQHELDKQRIHAELTQTQNDLTKARTDNEDMEQELQYSRVKQSELLEQGHNETPTTHLLQRKCAELVECQKDRDALEKRLQTTQARVSSLEQECELKRQLVEELSQSWDAALSSEHNISRLREEYDLSLKRATDLSVELAESRMKIDELQKQLHSDLSSMDNSESSSRSISRRMSWQQGFSKNLVKNFRNSIQRAEGGVGWLDNISEQQNHSKEMK